jgi:ribonuclease Z
MRKIGLIAVLVVIVGIYLNRAAVIEVVMERGMSARLDSNILDSLEDGLHVALCGAGGPMPAPNASGPVLLSLPGIGFTL